MPSIHSKNRSAKGVACVVLVAAIWGFYGVITRTLNESNFTVLQQIYLRLSVSSVAAFIVFNRFINYTKLKKLPKKEWLLLVIRGIASYLVGTVLFSQALIHTKVGSASLISALPLVPLAGFILFKEKVTYTKVLCTIGAFLGAFLIAAINLSNPLDWGKGEVFALLSVIGYTITYIGRKWHGQTLNNREMTAFMLAFGLLGVLTGSIVSGEGLPIKADWSVGVVGILIFAGLINVLNLLLINYIFEVLSNVLAGNLLMLEALFGIMCGFLIYGEVLTYRQLLGGVILIFSVMQLNRVEAKLSAAQAQPA